MRVFCGLLICAVLSVNADNAEADSNSIGVVSGVGTLFTDAHSEEDDGLVLLGAYYSHQINKTFAVEGAVLFGSSPCFINCTDSPYATFTSYQVNAKALLPVSRHWSFFGKLGANSYRIKYDPEHALPYSYQELGWQNKRVKGVGAVAAIGIEFKAQNGFHFGFQVQDLPMGSREYRGFTAYTGFSF